MEQGHLFEIEGESKAPDFPKYAVYRDEMCRVLYYEGEGMFRLLTPDDRQCSVHRERFRFARRKKQ